MNKIILIALTICYVTVQGQADAKFKKIDSLIQNNEIFDSMKALRKLKENFAKDSTNSDYWLRHSKASFLPWGYEEASSSIDKAIKLNPNDAELYFEKGVLSNKGRELEIALKALKKAIEIKKTGKYFFWKGVVNSNLNRVDNAQKDYEEAIKIKFERPELFNNLGIILMGKGKLEEALVIFNKAINHNKYYAEAYSERSKIHFFLLNFDLACKDIREINRLGKRIRFQLPNSFCNISLNEKLQYNADLLAGYKLYHRGIIAYTKLINNKTTKSNNFLNRGFCYFKTKDYANAEKDYLKALTLSNPSLSGVYNNLGLLYFEINDFEKSIKYVTKLIELNPKNPVAYVERGNCYRILKKYSEAEKDFNKSLELKPHFHRAFGNRSFLYLDQGQYNKSLEDASKSIKLNPQYAYGYLVLGQAKKELGISGFCKDMQNAKKYGNTDAEEFLKIYCK